MTNQPSERAMELSRAWVSPEVYETCTAYTDAQVDCARQIDAAIKEAVDEAIQVERRDSSKLRLLLVGKIDELGDRIKGLETALRKVLAQSWEDHVQRIAEEALNGGAGDE